VSPGTQRFAARRQIIAFSLDVVGIVVFAAIGRRSHDETDGLGSVLSTAAPFLLGLLLCWGLIGSGASNLLARRRPQLHDGASPDAGIVIWIVTVVVGLLARRLLWERGTAFAFVLVATLVLGALLAGRRLGLRWFEKRQNRS